MVKKEIFKLKANDIEFYCEMAGQGPLVVIAPDGSNDCTPYESFLNELCGKYTVLTFDMRGGLRSMDHYPKKVTPSVLGDDVAEIVRIIDKGKATVYGCSSGGQAVLAAGKRHPELFRNILVHEAALQADVPLPGTGFSYFMNLNSFSDYFTNSLTPNDFWGICNAEKAMGIGAETRERIEKNGEFWSEWYLGTVDMDTYTAEDFALMPPTAFTVGTWTPSWLTYANVQVAKRGNCRIQWVESSHHPEITCPKEYAIYMDEMISRYL